LFGTKPWCWHTNWEEFLGKVAWPFSFSGELFILVKDGDMQQTRHLAEPVVSSCLQVQGVVAVSGVLLSRVQEEQVEELEVLRAWVQVHGRSGLGWAFKL